MKPEHDTPAFARSATAHPTGAYIDGGAVGLTKREYFAALVLQGIAANGDYTTDTADFVAGVAVRTADALIVALNASAP